MATIDALAFAFSLRPDAQQYSGMATAATEITSPRCQIEERAYGSSTELNEPITLFEQFFRMI
jgi:hypothetical protein